MAVEVLLDAAPAPVERVAGEADHVERVHHRDRVGQLLGGGGLEPGEAVHRDHLELVAPGLGALGEPGLEHLFRAALDHVQQPRRAGAVTDRGQVDDHGHVLVAAAGVPPHVLIDADHLHAVEPGRVVDQDPPAFGQDRVVGGVPRHAQALGDPGHAQVLTHDPLQRPPQPPATAWPAARPPGWCLGATHARTRCTGSGAP